MLNMTRAIDFEVHNSCAPNHSLLINVSHIEIENVFSGTWKRFFLHLFYKKKKKAHLKLTFEYYLLCFLLEKP